VYVCPTVALTLRNRTTDDPVGPGTRRVAELDESTCYNAQNCLEVCPEEAIVMHELDEPFRIGVDPKVVDREAIGRICSSAGYHPKQPVCFCADVTAGEIAASCLLGAATPGDISVMTGARTGCTELCNQPVLRLLAAAGHSDPPRDPPRGFQVYGIAAQGFDLLDETGHVDAAVAAEFPLYPLDRDLQALRGNFEGA
jgi:NAD-dependent dihydropyrimidine dehydrogenase PreA subunit/bacterioferritin-associated ferredoxin